MITTYKVTTLLVNGNVKVIDGFGTDSIIVRELISGGAQLIKEETVTKEYNFNSNTEVSAKARNRTCSICGQIATAGRSDNGLFLCDCCLEDQGMYEPDC